MKRTLLSNYKVWLLLFLISGILLRLYHFFYNRALWMDEVYLSSSLLRMDYLDLAMQPLDYQQKAPIGFLWTVRFFVEIFGPTEQALRLFSLICGILSLFLFIPICRYFTNEKGAVVCLGILAFASPLVFHAVEVKQYQTEMFTTLLILYSYIKYQQKSTYPDLLVWGLIGALVLWFSYAAIFVLAGIATGLSFYRIIKKDWPMFFRQCIPFLIWFLSFGINYLYFTHRHAESRWIVDWFDFYKNFMPMPPKSIEDLEWYALNLYRLFDYPLGFLWTVKWLVLLPLSMLFLGLALFYKRLQDFLVLCFPFLFLFLASGLKLYPLTERFWVFISPILILFIGNGYLWCVSRFHNQLFNVVFALLLGSGLLLNSMEYVKHPEELIGHKRSFQREALAVLEEKFQAGDVVYVYWNDLPGYKVYQRIHPSSFKAIEGKDYRFVSTDVNSYLNRLKSDFEGIKGKKRVWFLYNDYYRTDIGDPIGQPAWYYEKGADPILKLLAHISAQGKQEAVFNSFDVKISLITLKGR
ncbi:ArnT family glycosyltransferase [Pedobacter gandavensis]|uniref:ArnT family glycosyltransferase n=1 Tax=Pedobacter gandavensis TaxID=2679963 RepID=UPI00292DA5F5|nr:glycosyltransferase family 39 protein [Pedobacter gandavensis]